jgi:hypothetical protein
MNSRVGSALPHGKRRAPTAVSNVQFASFFETGEGFLAVASLPMQRNPVRKWSRSSSRANG